MDPCFLDRDGGRSAQIGLNGGVCTPENEAQARCQTQGPSATGGIADVMLAGFSDGPSGWGCGRWCAVGFGRLGPWPGIKSLQSLGSEARRILGP